MSDVLSRLAGGHLQSELDMLLPWNWKLDKSRLRISSENDYVEQDYPAELLIKKLGLEGKVYIDNAGDPPDDQDSTRGSPRAHHDL